MENNSNNKNTLMLGIGTVLVCSWGYSMTLVDFYKVLKETDKTALVQKIGSIEKGDGGYLTGTAIPDESKNGDEQLRIYKIAPKDSRDWLLKSRKTGFNKYFDKWDGQPQGFNHCD